MSAQTRSCEVRTTHIHTGENAMYVEEFNASDGDHWFSVTNAATHDLATGVMHATRQEAETELRSFQA